MKSTKTKDDFNYKLQDVFNLMSIQGKYNIVGSSSLKGILYASDIDLNEKTKVSGKHPFEHVYDMFVQKFKIARENDNIFITDFKAGNNKDESIKWTYDKLIKNKDLFIKCLHTKSMIKLDIIYLLNGVYVDITEVYFLQIGDFKTYDDNELDSKMVLSELKKSYDECIKEGQFFKALKRLNSIMNINHKNTTITLTEFFNSQSGLLYKCYSDLNILLTLINNKFRKPKIEDIKNNLQIIKQMLSIQTETKQNVSKIIDDICKKKKLNEMFVYIDKLSIYLAKLFNRDAKEFGKNLNV